MYWKRMAQIPIFVFLARSDLWQIWRKTTGRTLLHQKWIQRIAAKALSKEVFTVRSNEGNPNGNEWWEQRRTLEICTSRKLWFLDWFWRWNRRNKRRTKLFKGGFYINLYNNNSLKSKDLTKWIHNKNSTNRFIQNLHWVLRAPNSCRI